MKKYFLNTALALAAALSLLSLTARASDAAQEMTVRGRLRTGVEAGCWMLVASGERKFHIINARQYEGESWFRAGAEVEAVGETRDVMTTCMEGTPFEARTLRPAGSSGSAGAPVTDGAAARQRTRVTVSGEAIVQAQPDTAVITIAVVTQNASASEAQAENASRSEAVLRAVRAAAGAGAEVKTSGYSLQPQMDYQPNMPPKITSYVARNAVLVTTGELARVGAVIDAATRAGANNVEGLAFTLRQDRPARSQALREATRDAMAKAGDIAAALGGRVVRIVEVSESGTYRPPMPVEYTRMTAQDAAAPPSTPILTGSLDVRAHVQIVAEIER